MRKRTTFDNRTHATVTIRATLRPAAWAAALTLLGAALAPATVAAQGTDRPAEPPAARDTGMREYAVSAGALGAALTSFSGQAGIALAFNPEQTAGMTSKGLQGRHTVQEGFARLLEGSGLQATPRSGGGYTLQRATSGTRSVTLSEVVVKAQRSDGTATENTGVYIRTAPTSAAAKLGLSQKETPQTVSVLTRQRLDDQGLDSLSTALEQTPGVSIQNLGSERFNIFSRGYSVNSYQFDGIPTSMDIVSQISAQSLADMAIYDHVEIIRGANGLTTGSGDPSATVNLVRKQPTRNFQGHASVSLGSWNLYRAEADVAGPINASGSLRGRLVAAHQQSDSYIDFYKQKKEVLYGVLQADVTADTRVTAGVDFQKNDPKGAFSSAGFPLWDSTGAQTDFSRSFSPAARWSRNEQTTTNTFATVEQRLPMDWSAKLSVNHMRTDREYSLASASWGFPDLASGDGVRLYGGAGETHQRQTGIDAQVQGPFALLGRQHELVAGFTASRFRNLHQPLAGAGIEGRYVNLYSWDNDTAQPITTGGKLYDGDTVVRQTGAYLATRLNPRDDLKVILGARVSNYRYSYDLQYIPAASVRFNSLTKSRESGVLTPYAGVVFDLNRQHSVYASYTSIFKPQTVRDRDGATLDPREGTNYELGLKSSFADDRVQTAVAVFQSQQDNLAVVDTGYIVPGTTSTAAYRSVQGAKTRGIDLEVNGEIARHWHVAASFTHSKTDDADGIRLNTVAPLNLFKLWTTYRLPGAMNRLTVGGGANWQSAMFLTAAPSAIGKTVTARQGRYTVFNLMGRYEFSQQLSATLNIGNVFDKRYLSAIDSTFYSGYYGAPRNVRLNVNYLF